MSETKNFHSVISKLLGGQRIATLATVDDDGLPHASLVPFALLREQASLLIHVSALAPHFGYLKRQLQAAVLISKPEIAGEEVAVEESAAKVEKPKKEPGFVLKIWDKYGVIGLGLLGTMTVGAPISMGIGVGFNVSTNKMVFWCSLGVLIRCALFTSIGHYSLQLF